MSPLHLGKKMEREENSWEFIFLLFLIPTPSFNRYKIKNETATNAQFSLSDSIYLTGAKKRKQTNRKKENPFKSSLRTMKHIK